MKMTHLPRGIYRRGSSYYLSYRDETGKLVRRSAGKDLQKAIEQLRMVHRDQAQGNGFVALVNSYLERQEVYSKRGSVKNARSCVNRLIQHFGDVELASLRALDLDRFISKPRAQGVTNKTINGDLIILRAVLNHALAVRSV